MVKVIGFIIICLQMIAFAAYAETIVCTKGKDCPQDKAWDIGLAIGLGMRTNPLVDGDTIPLIVLPDIVYSNKHIYFDNGELGWRAYSNETNKLSVFVSPNKESANFSFWHSANIFTPITNVGSGPVDNPDVDEGSAELPDNVSVNDIAKRKWAVDLGLRWQWQYKRAYLNLAWMNDISGVYKGSHFELATSFKSTIQDWTILISPYVKWHSDKLSNYYYSIRKAELVEQGYQYSAAGGWQYGIQTSLSKTIGKHWNLLILAGTLRLHDGMQKSPLVETNTINFGFVGAAYRF